MHGASISQTATTQRSGAGAFARAVLQAVTWRAVLITQALAVTFAITPWLEQWHRASQPHLLESVIRQATTALIVMLAAYAGDEAVRRGSSVWRAFAVVVLAASAVNAVAQSFVSYGLGLGASARGLLDPLDNFLSVGGFWGTALMVFLNRQAAQRLLRRLRTGELERAEGERRLTGSRLAAAEAQIDSSALLRQLADVRDLYEAGADEAEPRFEALITRLRETLARSAHAQAHEANG